MDFVEIYVQFIIRLVSPILHKGLFSYIIGFDNSIRSSSSSSHFLYFMAQQDFNYSEIYKYGWPRHVLVLCTRLPILLPIYHNNELRQRQAYERHGPQRSRQSQACLCLAHHILTGILVV